MTKIITSIASESKLFEYELDEGFEQVIEKVYPLRPPESPHENRGNMIFQVDDGEKVCIPSSMILIIKG